VAETDPAPTSDLPALRAGAVLRESLALLARDAGPLLGFSLALNAIAFGGQLLLLSGGPSASRAEWARNLEAVVFFLVAPMLVALLGLRVLREVHGAAGDLGTSLTKGAARLPRVIGTAFSLVVTAFWRMLRALVEGFVALGTSVAGVFRRSRGTERSPWTDLFGALFAILTFPAQFFVAFCAYFVAPPASLLEGGVSKALRRSDRLTQGHKGAVFQVLLAAYGLAAFAFVVAIDPKAPFTVERAAVGAAVAVPFCAYQAVATLVAYAHLRRIAAGSVPEPSTVLV
jgi:hypothetical protein